MALIGFAGYTDSQSRKTSNMAQPSLSVEVKASLPDWGLLSILFFAPVE
jgi:hypothetical protein